MRIFATEFTVIGRCDYSIADTDLFSVDLVVALGGDVECLFSINYKELPSACLR